MFAQAASFSPTRTFATSAAASAVGSVVRTSRASAIARSALPQPAESVGNRGRSLQSLGDHPADDLAAAGPQDADPAAHGQSEEPAAQPDPDLVLGILRNDVLEEEDPEVAD